jgi:hypothetical protein
MAVVPQLKSCKLSCMRDIKRIKPFLKEIEKQWSKYPDWRFGQWFFNEVISRIGDPFFIEDDELLSLIKKYDKKK